MKSILQKQSGRDSLAIIGVLILYNLFFIFPNTNLEYINFYKILWMFIGGFLLFIPLYGVLFLCLRKADSVPLLIFVSLALWLTYPIILDGIFHGPGSNFTYARGGKTIYLNGDLTRYGYFYFLQNPFIFLHLHAVIFYFSNKYQHLFAVKGT